MKQGYERLEAVCKKLGAVKNAPMSRYTSFRTGGPAKLLAEPCGAQELMELIGALEACAEPYTVIGNGTNLLVSDKGLNMTVVRIGEPMGAVCREGNRFYAEAGASFSALARASVEAGFQGLEWGAGIPGSVGGAVAMNAGAYGGETAATLASVTYYEQGRIVEEKADKAAFSYRISPYSYPGRIVVGARFALEADDGGAAARMREYTALRKAKQPLAYPSAGSTFKRPKGNFAGALIEQAGLKGGRVGGAEVSALRAGFLINTGGATSADVYALLRLVQEAVYAHSGVLLEPEIRLLGEF